MTFFLIGLMGFIPLLILDRLVVIGSRLKKIIKILEKK